MKAQQATLDVGCSPTGSLPEDNSKSGLLYKCFGCGLETDPDEIGHPGEGQYGEYIPQSCPTCSEPLYDRTHPGPSWNSIQNQGLERVARIEHDKAVANAADRVKSRPVVRRPPPTKSRWAPREPYTRDVQRPTHIIGPGGRVIHVQVYK